MQKVLTQHSVRLCSRLGLRYKTSHSTDGRTELCGRWLRLERAWSFDHVFSILAGISRGSSEPLIEGSCFIRGHYIPTPISTPVSQLLMDGLQHCLKCFKAGNEFQLCQSTSARQMLGTINQMANYLAINGLISIT